MPIAPSVVGRYPFVRVISIVYPYHRVISYYCVYLLLCMFNDAKTNVTNWWWTDIKCLL